MRVAVLGCGPAGLIAAHGVLMADPSAQVTILSRKVKSPMYGAQYLHNLPPGIPDTGHTIVNYTLLGDADGYRRKVYGPMWDGKVSPEDLLGEHHAWDIRGAYDWLWGEYGDLIHHTEIEPWLVEQAIAKEHLVINSIPRPAICRMGHTFGSTAIIAAGEAPEVGIRLPYQCPDSTVICNGADNPSWYRMCRVFGRTTVEWPGEIGRVPITSAATVQKPTYTNCDCYPQVMHVGRYGRWEKGVLSHESYMAAYKAVQMKMHVGQSLDISDRWYPR